MKILILKTNRILMLFCILMLTMLTFSCSKDKDDDDNNNKTSTSLIGKWQYEETYNEGGVYDRNVYVLNFINASKGTLSAYFYENGYLEGSYNEDFTYFTKSGTLTTTGDIGEVKYTVKKSTLTLIYDNGETEKWTKI